MRRKSVPEHSILNSLEYLGYFSGRKRWRSDNGWLYEWDALHGEIEVYNKRGKHLGVMDYETGQLVKPPVKGRKIDV